MNGASKVRYLVRKLTLIDNKGMETVHSLVYFEGVPVEKCPGFFHSVVISPFKHERAGYSYLLDFTAKLL